MSPVLVERLAEISLLVEDREAATAAIRTALGATVRADTPQRWLVAVGRTVISVTAVGEPDRPAGSRLAGPEPGWRGIRWVVPSMVATATASAQPGAGSGDGRATDPEHLHGLSVELAGQAEAGNAVSGENPLGIVGVPNIRVATGTPQKAAEELGDLVALATDTVEYTHLNAIGHGVGFPDHRIEFTGSLSGSTQDLVGGFLASHGEGIFAVSFRVADFFVARAHLVANDVRFTQWGKHTLLLERVTRGGLIELTDKT